MDEPQIHITRRMTLKDVIKLRKSEGILKKKHPPPKFWVPPTRKPSKDKSKTLTAKQSEYLERKKSIMKMTRIDHTALWSVGANRKRRFHRMDPKPDPPFDDTPEPHDILKDKTGKIKLVLTEEDWQKFWVDRIRRHYKVDAPNISDREIYFSVDRSRRIYLRNREEGLNPHVDPDMPPCFYWDKFKVAQWVESCGFPEFVKDVILLCDISGRRLILLDACSLTKMGIHDHKTIMKITTAVRELLRLPPPNTLRAISRIVPLERFLFRKIRTGANINRLTFKKFCEQEGIDYEVAKQQKDEGYKKLPKAIKVTICPEEKEDIKWIGVEKPDRPLTSKLPYFPYRSSAEYDIHTSGTNDSSSSDGVTLVEEVPTVEELVQNAMLRNEYIPEILNAILEAVLGEIRKRKMGDKCRQQVADQILREKMQDAYAYFNVANPEEKLKLITIIAEELVEDVMRAREVLEDIDRFQERIEKNIEREEMDELQEAVSHYVQDIMPHVVNAALKEMKNSEEDLMMDLNSEEERKVREICVLKSPSDYDYSADSESSSEDEILLYQSSRSSSEEILEIVEKKTLNSDSYVDVGI